MRRSSTFIGCLALVFLTVPLQAQEASMIKTLSRAMDPVIITGKESALSGKAIAQYGLAALNNGVLAPIPFQIDEKDGEGKFILTAGKRPKQARGNALFDDTDELVFMAMDTGDRLPEASDMLKNAKTAVEIEVTDPVSTEKGWVYLTLSESDAQRSSLDYVSYDPATPAFKTRNYSGQYNRKFPAGASKYAFEAGLGGRGDDFIDRIKIRVKTKSMGLSINRTEADILVEEEGYIDGPVRVIVYTKNITPLFLGIPASATHQYTYYYDTYADFAFKAGFPIKPGYFRAMVIDDFKNATGWRFYNSNNREGHLIDGKMDDTDRKLDLSPWRWSVLSNGDFSFWSVWIAPPGCPVKASLYFKDDLGAEDPLEENQGEAPGIGFDFNTGWEAVKTSSVEIRLLHFYTKGYQKGMEETILNIHEKPLTTRPIRR